MPGAYGCDLLTRTALDPLLRRADPGRVSDETHDRPEGPWAMLTAGVPLTLLLDLAYGPPDRAVLRAETPRVRVVEDRPLYR
jgi:hypothetical protein